MTTPSPHQVETPSFAEMFTPKLVTVFREGYGGRDLRADLLAGMTVAIVALPLSMAIAIASGVTPDRGIYTAIFGGAMVSLFGGSRFQIGGPAGAFIVLVAATAARHGVDGLLLATFLSGLIMAALGLLRIGTYIKYIPYPVTVGFTSGIAAIIFASQIRPFLGLTLPGGEPGPLIAKLAALADAVGTITPTAAAVAVATIAVIVGLRQFRPGWPGMLLAVGLAALGTWGLDLPIETIGTRFGGIPTLPPAPALPDISMAKVIAVLPDAAAFALLGAIESLLSAIVADGMTGRRHRSNCELLAQGLANIVSPIFGGICVTGTIARTVTNVRSGARGPLAGIFHSSFLLGFMLLAAPLASFIPLAALAGVLALVAWNMAEKHAFAGLLRASRGDALVLLATFLLTIFEDLTFGIVVGTALGAMLFIHRMALSISVETAGSFALEDVADTSPEARPAYDPALAANPDIVVYRITGAFFFGAAATVGSVLERISDRHKAFVIDLSAASFIDSTGANTLAGVVTKAGRAGVRVYIVGATPAARQILAAQGCKPPKVSILATVEAAIADIHAAEKPTRASGS